MNKLIRQAFTLIELLVVIAIIGILSGLIVVSMSGVTDKANITKVNVFSNSLKNSLMMNLISEWRFDGSGVSDGGVATTEYTQDYWTHNNGSIVGSPLVRMGDKCISGSCLEFISRSTYLTVNTITLSPANGYTISFWANFQAKAVDGNMTIGDTSGTTKSYIWFTNAGNYVQITGTGEVSILSGTLTNVYNGWNHWVFTYNGSTANLYRNGSIVLTNPSAPSLVFGVSRIGMAYNGAYYLKGKLDDVRIFNGAVPISQIKEQYYSGLNSMLAKGIMTKDEYNNRLSEMALR